MIVAPKPENETLRLQELESFKILDSDMEQDYNKIVEMASLICETPIALISLLHKERQWFKAKVGVNSEETPRDISFCSHGILGNQPFIVKNAQKDERFYDNPFVINDPKIVYYCGIPLETKNKLVLGTLCVLDKKERELKPFQIQMLEFLGNQIISLLELRRSNRLLLESKSKLDTFFDLSPDFLGIADGNGFFKKISRSFSEKLGFSEKDLLSQPFLSFVHPEDVRSTLNEMGEMSFNRKSIDFRNRYRTASGQFIHISWMASADREGAFYAIGRDITSQVTIENELKQEKERADLAVQLRSRFLANMSHEIRTPLHGVLGNVTLLLDTALSDAQQKMLGTIQNCGQSLLFLIDDILDLSKIEAGKLSVYNQPFHLVFAIEEVFDILSPQISEKALTTQFTVSKDIPQVIIADYVRLRQILTNLLGNSVKFTHHGGVTINAEISRRWGDRLEICIDVTDTGIGMDKADQTSLFQDFFQIDTSSTRKYGGTGLGLSISRHLARLMKGDMWVESTKGQGSTFSFSFEAQIAQEKDQPVNIDQHVTTHIMPSINSIKILLVEDNKVNQEIGIKFFKKLGFSVDLAENGREAVDACLRTAYDVVFMDVHMPVMDGHEATQTIRACNLSYPQPKIIALTASVLNEDRQKCFDAGMDDFLRKPLQLQELITVLKTQGLYHTKIPEPPSEAMPVLPEESLWKDILKNFDNDQELVATIIDTYLEELPGSLEEILKAWEAKNYPELKKAAHSLKGASSNLSTLWVTQVCFELELAAKNIELEKIPHLLGKLKKELELFSKFLHQKMEHL
jgi:PAS domain S-box-containing protein